VCLIQKQKNIPWVTSLKAMYEATAPVSASVPYWAINFEIRVSLAQNVREKPLRAPWNNNNPEFE